MKNTIILLTTLLFLMSCKKDKLEGDKEILIGKWKWEKTLYESYNCQNCCPVNDTLIPTNANYEIEFIRKGKVKFYKNEVITSEQIIVFDDFYKLDGNDVFDIHLNDDPTMRLLGIIYGNGDSLYTWDYPYKANNDPCDEEYLNYFYKEK